MNTKAMKGIGLFLMIVLAAAGIFFGLQKEDADEKKDARTIMEESSETHSSRNSEIKIVDENIKTNVIIEILRSSDEIYLKNSAGADFLIYLADNDIKNIEMMLSLLELENANIPIIFQEFDYELYLQSKNIHIYFNKNRVFIKDESGFSGYRDNSEGLTKLINELEAVYLEHLNTYIQGIVPKEVVIEAVDNDRKILADEELTEEIKKVLEFVGAIDNPSMKRVSPEYPLYKVAMSSEARNAVLTFMNNEVIRLDIMGEISYFKVKPELVELIKGSVQERYEEKKLLFSDLFNSHTLIVDDAGDKYDFEDQSYYRLEFIRALIKAEKEPAEKEIGPRNKARASLKFLFNDKKSEIILYDDYIQYEDKIYKSPLIADNIFKIITQ